MVAANEFPPLRAGDLKCLQPPLSMPPAFDLLAGFRRDDRVHGGVLVVSGLHDEAVEPVHRRAAAQHTARGERRGGLCVL